MNNNYKNISFFEGLNSLRFFAAFLVVMHHSETIRSKNGLFNFEWLGLFKNGVNAVTFFFVLSGFLITYLLLKESNKTSTVSIKQFYLKRVLRIWPLYFLLVIIGALLLPTAFNIFGINYIMPYTFAQTWYYFVFFLPGLVAFYFGHHLLEPLWSIGIEEVFYLIWAPIFKIAKQKILVILLSIIIIKIVLMTIANYWIKDPLFVYLVNIFRFEAMAIGGLGAYFIFHRNKSLNTIFVYNKTVQVLIYSTLIVFLVFHSNIHHPVWNVIFNTPIFSSLLINFLFLYLIVGVSLIDHNLFKFRNKFLSYLGEISYGIYMYHLLIIFGMIQFLKTILMNLSPSISTIVYYGILTISVILVASASKLLFENYFLNLKKKVEKSQIN